MIRRGGSAETFATLQVDVLHTGSRIDVLALDEVWPEFRPVGYQVSGPSGNRTCIAMYSNTAVGISFKNDQRSCESENLRRSAIELRR